MKEFNVVGHDQVTKLPSDLFDAKGYKILIYTLLYIWPPIKI